MNQNDIIKEISNLYEETSKAAKKYFSLLKKLKALFEKHCITYQRYKPGRCLKYCNNAFCPYAIPDNSPINQGDLFEYKD